MQLTRTVAPTSMPVTLAEAKDHCRVYHDDDDDYLTALVNAATTYVDGPTGILGRCLLTQTWRVDLPGWADPIILPVDPVVSVTVAYNDAAGASQTLDANAYTLTKAEGARPAIWLKAGTQWPALAAEPYPVRIAAVCGAATCPQDMKVALLMLVGHWHRNRVVAASGAMTEVPIAFDAIIGKGRRLVV
jgi:uncharacterized phiE125 gp8 family phage protein